MCDIVVSTAPFDYMSMMNEPLTFTSDSSSDSVDISIRDDAIVEGLESFVANLSVDAVLYPRVRLSPDTTIVNIISDDGNNVLFNPNLCLVFIVLFYYKLSWQLWLALTKWSTPLTKT